MKTKNEVKLKFQVGIIQTESKTKNDNNKYNKLIKLITHECNEPSPNSIILISIEEEVEEKEGEERILLNFFEKLSSQMDEYKGKSNDKLNFAFIIPFKIYQNCESSFNQQLCKLVNENPFINNLILITPLVLDVNYITSLVETCLPTPIVTIGLHINKKSLLNSPKSMINCFKLLNVSIALIDDDIMGRPSDTKDEFSYVNDLNGEPYINNLQTLITKRNPPILFVNENDTKLPINDKINFIKQVTYSINWDVYTNVLIEPLQPLRDDLEEEIYEIFEEDKVKYHQYEKAIELAIKDLQKNQNQNQIQGDKLKILIVGPGRGPLIDIVLQLCQQLGDLQNIEIIAIEKNNKIFQMLQSQNLNKWFNSIKLINQDVRKMNSNFFTQFNLVISELLGSFACNELSPDILKNFENCIMIPSNYENFVIPIYSNILTNLEEYRPYLIKLGEYYQLDNHQLVFEFNHSLNDHNIQLNQSKHIEFKNYNKLRINGFKGFFLANLYESISISNIENYEMKSDCQIFGEFCKSWFPMIFPIYVTANENITIKFSRLCDLEGVWYTWEINNIIYNENGKDYKIMY